MKKYLYVIATVIVILLIGFGVIQTMRFSNIKQQYDIAVQNNKAYESQLDVLNQENKVFQFTVEQLRYINDSSIKQMDSMRRELGIKDKKIKQMGKIKEYVYITDSIKVHDTIFAKEDFVMDTTLGDEWYTNNIHLQYPDMISSTISVNNDQSVFLYTTRETVNPPKKTWLGRLFQRKHDVYNVTVVELNPYSTVKENKFVIISK